MGECRWVVKGPLEGGQDGDMSASHREDAIRVAKAHFLPCPRISCEVRVDGRGDFLRTALEIGQQLPEKGEFRIVVTELNTDHLREELTG